MTRGGKRPGAGRPKTDNRSVLITIAPDLLRLLDARMAETGRRRSAIIGAALRAYLGQIDTQ